MNRIVYFDKKVIDICKLSIISVIEYEEGGDYYFYYVVDGHKFWISSADREDVKKQREILVKKWND